MRINSVNAAGVTVLDPLPERSVMIVATQAQVAALGSLPFVQYVGPYLPEYKFQPNAPNDHALFTLQIADTPLSAATVARIREQVGGFLSADRYAAQLTARFTSTMTTARALVDEPFVIGVSAYVPPALSDERTALSATGISTLPAPQGYLAWLQARGITPNALTNSRIVVDVADTGVDNGCGSANKRHADLAGRVISHKGTTGGTVFPYYADTEGHGTIVAGIVGGNPGPGINTATPSTVTNGHNLPDVDSFGQYVHGMGVAPGIRIGNTKIIAIGPQGSVSAWTKLAVEQQCDQPTAPCPATPTGDPCPATVQTYSTNEYTPSTPGSLAGKYTDMARAFDFSVRNANGSTPPTALAITVAAGNYAQNTGDTTKTVMPPATAKNVIAMGGVTTKRQTPLAQTLAPCLSDTTGGNNPQLRHKTNGYNALAYFSRRGTIDSRFKPDLLAPASVILGPRRMELSGRACATAGVSGTTTYPEYHGSSGTSYASPAAAGSIALLRYYYATNYALVPSPAMYKAMLVAGARSITNQPDELETYLHGGTTYNVTAWPNAQQGFGVINLDSLLSPTPVKTWHDQATILYQGQTFQRTVTVNDSSQPMRIVMAYSDAPATSFATVALVNDLQLTAEFTAFPYLLGGNYTDASGWSRVHVACQSGQPGGCVVPNDPRNNVEVLNISSSRFVNVANRTFTVKVRVVTLNGDGLQNGGVYDQDFALFLINGRLQ